MHPAQEIEIRQHPLSAAGGFQFQSTGILARHGAPSDKLVTVFENRAHVAPKCATQLAPQNVAYRPALEQ